MITYPMLIIKFIFASLIAIPVVVFFYQNGQMVTLDFWPFPKQYTMPLSFILFLVFTAGAIIGGVLVWFNQIGLRLKSKFRSTDNQ